VSQAHARARLLDVLEREQLDALVASTPENVQYATGFMSVEHPLFHGVEYYAVVTRAGSALVVPVADVPAAVAAGATADAVACYGRFMLEYAEPPGFFGQRVRELTNAPHSTGAEALAAVLRQLGVSSDRVGIDEGYVLPQTWMALGARLGTPRPAAALWRDARMVKSLDEVETLATAARIAEDAVAAVCGMLRTGTTEREAAAIFHSEVIRRGALPYFTVIAIGERSAIPDVIATDYAARPGDLVRFDLGCATAGYRSDIARSAVIGTPSEKHRRYYGAIKEGQSAAIAAIKPGRTAGEIFQIAVSAARAAGLPHYRRTHVGHGIGLEAYDPPTLSVDNPTVLQRGMVLCVETPYYEYGWGGIQVEDLVEVTATGARVLTRSSRDLAVLPL
jgi:Xaa-Pro aminopeptidase